MLKPSKLKSSINESGNSVPLSFGTPLNDPMKLTAQIVPRSGFALSERAQFYTTYFFGPFTALVGAFAAGVKYNADTGTHRLEEKKLYLELAKVDIELAMNLYKLADAKNNTELRNIAVQEFQKGFLGTQKKTGSARTELFLSERSEERERETATKRTKEG
mmetsp:Transcript_50479/g.99336  ORF Transcript_50479/g.99336 Transcript_50479/m.99336 type:complete len:161 (+) Transcript_50479:287-769(+)